MGLTRDFAQEPELASTASGSIVSSESVDVSCVGIRIVRSSQTGSPDLISSGALYDTSCPCRVLVSGNLGAFYAFDGIAYVALNVVSYMTYDT